MNAGTLGRLEEPTDEPLDSWIREPSKPPALDVHGTQEQLSGTPIQTGMAAGTVDETKTRVTISGTDISTEQVKESEVVATEWCADVTDTGIVAAASVYNTAKEHPFPFDLLTFETGVKVNRVEIDTARLYEEWDTEDQIRETWMASEQQTDEDGETQATIMKYGDAATPESPAETNAGVGFLTTWEGTVVKGVCHQSGYVSLYRDMDAGAFIDFVNDEIMPFAETVEPEHAPGVQQKLEAAREAMDDV